MNPNTAEDWKEAESNAGVPNHELGTGAFTFFPVRAPPSIFSTSIPRT
jgi:hypothetical protein